jgi:hypothetical protein
MAAKLGCGVVVNADSGAELYRIAMSRPGWAKEARFLSVINESTNALREQLMKQRKCEPHALLRDEHQRLRDSLPNPVADVGPDRTELTPL